MSARDPSQLAVALYRRELLPWLLAGCTLGLVEGATAAVLIKRGFADSVPHNDFASLGKVQQYMDENVTLTGMRGLVAPPPGAIGFNRMKHKRTGIAQA